MTIHPDLIVSLSGIRGLVGTSLTPDVAMRFATAYGASRTGKLVLVSRDGRPSGESLGAAVIAGLTAVGCRVVDLGIAPTPTVGVAVTHLKAAGAIQITASHNPAPWNGLKLFGDDGAVLPAEAGAAVKATFESGHVAWQKWDGVGRVTTGEGIFDEHIRRVATVVPPWAIRTANFRALVDGNGGSGGPLALKLLNHYGVLSTAVGCESNGIFAHEAEPIPAHLIDVAPKVPGHAVGFVLDPDADRLALIDERGVCVSEETTLALAVKYALATRSGPVVVNMSTSRVNEDVAKAAGQAFHRSAVGEANVVALLRSTNAAIGGEGNGGVIDPQVGWVRDPFVGMAMILGLLAREGKPLSKIVEDLPSYSMLKTKFPVAPAKLPTAYANLKAEWPTATVNSIDGLRLDGPDWWLHVRPSNTEPVVRAIAEAPTATQAQALCDRAAAIIRAIP
jgi:phosphomannomutase